MLVYELPEKGGVPEKHEGGKTACNFMHVACGCVGCIGVNGKCSLSNTEIRMTVSRKEHAERSAGKCGEKRRNMRKEGQEHAERSAGTCGKKCRNMRREAQEHAERRAGTCEEKIRNMRREVQEHVEKIAGIFGEKRRNMWREA